MTATFKIEINNTFISKNEKMLLILLIYILQLSELVAATWDNMEVPVGIFRLYCLYGLHPLDLLGWFTDA